MTHDTDIYDALQEIERVEDELAAAVRNSKREADGGTETPVIKTKHIDDLRDDLTRARADLVDALLGEHYDRLSMSRKYSQEIANAPPGSTIILDEAQGTVETRKGDE